MDLLQMLRDRVRMKYSQQNTKSKTSPKKKQVKKATKPIIEKPKTLTQNKTPEKQPIQKKKPISPKKKPTIKK